MLALLLLISLGTAQSVSAVSPDAEEARTAAASEAPLAATPAPSRQRLRCRTRPILGSRIASQRVCKTEEEWAIYENDLEQSRRDINDRGARGCVPGRSCE